MIHMHYTKTWQNRGVIMKVSILKEAGYEEACLGISLSYNSTPERAMEVAMKLAPKDGGHNKFLESMVVWIDVTAPRYFWQQFDTYRIGVTKQSESTMHTIMKRNLEMGDFAEGTQVGAVAIVNHHRSKGDFDAVKKNLPESFMQRRIVCTNYKALRNIIMQRQGHKLQEWKDFCVEIRTKVLYPQLLPERD